MVKFTRAFAVCIVAVAGFALQNQQADERHSSPALPKDTLPKEINLDAIPIGFEEAAPIPVDNPQAGPKVALGRKLFFDPVLSENDTVSCASCHQPEHGFASPDAVAIGLHGRKGKRNAPSLLNRAYGEVFLWDGSAGSLEAQALTPISNPDELGGTVADVIAKLKSSSEYVAAFHQSLRRRSESRAVR